MLLWMPPNPADGSDDDEKAVKLKRKKARRPRMSVPNVFLSLVVLAVVALVTMAHMRHISKSSGGASLSSQSRLPSNSIYRLAVPNIVGEMTSLHQYAGQVTLVVNTACL